MPRVGGLQGDGWGSGLEMQGPTFTVVTSSTATTISAPYNRIGSGGLTALAVVKVPGRRKSRTGRRPETGPVPEPRLRSAAAGRRPWGRSVSDGSRRPAGSRRGNGHSVRCPVMQNMGAMLGRSLWTSARTSRVRPSPWWHRVSLPGSRATWFHRRRRNSASSASLMSLVPMVHQPLPSSEKETETRVPENTWVRVSCGLRPGRRGVLQESRGGGPGKWSEGPASRVPQRDQVKGTALDRDRRQDQSVAISGKLSSYHRPKLTPVHAALNHSGH